MNQHEEASIINIDEGSALTKFDLELKKAIANCQDPNTDAKVVRKITLELKLIPDNERRKLSASFVVKSTLAPDSARSDQILVSQKGKAFVTRDHQMVFEGYEDVTEIDEAKKEGTSGKKEK